jgi:hypothetical protein
MSVITIPRSRCSVLDPRRVPLGVALAGALAACGPSGNASAEGPEQGRVSIGVEVLDTLRTLGEPILADPIGLYVDATDRYVAVDRSDKNIKLFNATGRFVGAVGRPGPGPGEFGALWGGGALSDSIFGYDFVQMHLAVFSPAGDYVRSFPIRGKDDPVPITVLPVDDSLLLIVGFPVDGYKRDLLALRRRDGSVRSRFLNLRRYFTTDDSQLHQHSLVVADAASGVVVAGLRGGDSIWVFDYDGRRLGAAPIRVDGRSLRTYRSLIEENRGNVTRPDGSYVIDNENTLMAVVVVSPTEALLQVMRTKVGEQPWVDLTEGGRFLVARIDTTRGTVAIEDGPEIERGLLGRGRDGAALAYRFLGEEYDMVEVSRLHLRPNR